ncbi:hypothetical protein ABFS83_08G187000 [Erythranthe nasuta]
MRLSRSESVVERNKDKKLRNKHKGREKHKRLDSICEKSYTSSQKEVEDVEPSGLINGDDELELRRSNRARKAPVLLDSSPMPPKKRQKTVGKVRREDAVEDSGTPCSSSRDSKENGGWKSRLRSNGRSTGRSGKVKGESSMKGKRKLFDDIDGYRDDVEPQRGNKKEGSVNDKSTVVKSKRPGRIKASNVSANENQESSLVGGVVDGVGDGNEENTDQILEVDELHSETKLEYKSEIGVEDQPVASQLAEKEETAEEAEIEIAVQRESEIEECHINGNIEIREECSELEKSACDRLPVDGNVATVDCAMSDQTKDEGHPEKDLEDETLKKSKGRYSAAVIADRKPRVKLGRRCGLCGGGTDGKPPKVLLLEGAGSDNEAYSGSSASEEPNYDVWDGFGDQSGWLGRLLGPINDRFGIAGIWVHQQCAVWSPEVYFAGLGCLKNVRAALYRGRVLKCSRCRRPGATIGCRVDRCPKTYHLPCARSRSCIFDHRKFLIACNDHRHLFRPHGIQNDQWLKKLKAKRLKLELRKVANDACRKDIEVEEKWLENCGEDEEFLKRESKRLHRDLLRIAPTFIGGPNSEPEKQYQGWESVAGLQDVIRCMKEVVILPLLYPDFFGNLGLTPPRGVLLHGYPGTGKTLVVRALVGSCARGDRRIAYFARKGADCLGKYVGDAERQLRLLFQVAEKSQPSIIFFDEIDGLAPCRTKQQDQTHNSVVSTLLALMDGLKSRGSVIVIGATNRPDAVDPALRRPGRFDREIYFPLPSVTDREAILTLHTRKWPKPVTGSLLDWVAKETGGYAGADLQALCTQAAIIALRRSFPLQQVLTAAETRATDSKRPAIPTFTVEEKDWLKALLCAPPPCSRRESGIALNDVVSSPLKVHLVPCLLQPLTKLLVRLYVDERVWLPPYLRKASSSVKNVIVSALDRRRVKGDNWWLHVDGLLQEADVANEIEQNLTLANILAGKTNQCGFNVIEENTDEGSKIMPPNSQCMGARTGLLQNMSGFQMLICGDPRSGQRHLASCLLHNFVGDIDVWKVDLASISHEGHGDMVHGLARILMRCTTANVCMLYMPAIDLWAIETYDKASEHECGSSSSMEAEPSERMSCDGDCEVDTEHGIPSADVEEATQSETAARKASYLWTTFIQQVESMRVNTSLMILATSELAFSLLPDRIRQFFGIEIVGCNLSKPVDHKVPQFSVQLDGKFDHDKMINSFAAKLTNDLAQHFVQSLHSGSHSHEISFEEKTHDTVEGDADRVSRSKPCHISEPNPAVPTNKTLKGKSSLMLAISTVGYQILCYPHFAELCWVTSKLKEGPCANSNGPWRGWPFNSCIVRPIDSMEKVVASADSILGNSKSKKSGLVRGLVAIGLSAYRGEYSSTREICSEVRKVLETLVGRIDEKIQAGKDRSQFIRLLSQVAYLEDMFSNWAHTLQSLEMDTRISEANTNTCVEMPDNLVLKDGISNVDLHGSQVFDESPQEVNNNADAEHSNPTDIANGVTVEEPPSNPVVSDDICSPKQTIASNEVNLSSKAESEHSSVKLCNGFTESSSNFQAGGLSSLIDSTILRKSTDKNSCENDKVNSESKPSSSVTGECPAATMCFYECCSECFANLNKLLLRIINTRWELKGSDYSTVEDVHDFVASLSANLHLSLSKMPKLPPGENSRSENVKIGECENSDKWLTTECDCHATGKNMSRKEESRFYFKDGVLATIDTDIDGVDYHCKFEKLCLYFLIEWLRDGKKGADF